MRRFILSSVVALGLAVLPGMKASAAEPALDILDSPESYSADFTVTSSRGTYHGQVWHMHGLERRDVETKGGGQGVLIDRAHDAAYLLGLSGKWYVGLSLQAAGGLAGGLDAWTVERSRVREESVGGRRVTRWKTRAEGPKGGFSGDIWTTREGIVVKASGLMSNAEGDDSLVEMSLSNLRLGLADRQMLELPKGWFGFDLRKVPPDKIVQAVESIKPLLEGRSKGR